jgi:hypothetical protein
MKIAFDQAALARRYGFHVMASMGKEATGLKLMDRDMAYDAQPQLVTAANAGVPSLFTTFVDPAIIEIVLEPLNAAEFYGETKKGSWVSDTAMFITAERAGYVSSYGDFSQAGRVSANINYPQRQSYHFQTFCEYGERELEREAEGRVDWVNQLNASTLRVMMQFQNDSYLFGVAGLQNYGGVNDPALSAPIAPTQNWTTQTDPLVIYGDVLRLVQLLISQSNGILDAKSEFRMGLSPTNALNLNKSNQFNLNVLTQIKTNFPNLTIYTIPQFATGQNTAGELVQLYAPMVRGQKTVECAFTEKMRSHAVVTKASSWEQKKSAGTWGTIYYRPIMVVQMVG